MPRCAPPAACLIRHHTLRAELRLMCAATYERQRLFYFSPRMMFSTPCCFILFAHDYAHGLMLLRCLKLEMPYDAAPATRPLTAERHASCRAIILMRGAALPRCRYSTDMRAKMLMLPTLMACHSIHNLLLHIYATAIDVCRCRLLSRYSLTR